MSLTEFFCAPVVEPQKRNKDGMRWVMHRFPIKGGISLREAMRRDLFELHRRPNALLAKIRRSTDG